MWWTCPFPKCGFTVSADLGIQPKAQRRKKHLNRKHNLKGDALSALSAKERVQRVLQKQQTPASRTVSTKPSREHSLKLPVFHSSPSSSSSSQEVWWRCTCGFEVSKSEDMNLASRQKFKHLRAEHGILRNNYEGQRAVAKSIAPKRLNAAQVAHDFSWNVQWQEFTAKRGPGTHDLPRDPTTWRQYHVKNGVSIWAHFHKCKNCGIEVRRPDWPLYLCPMPKNKKKPFSLDKRKSIWNTCHKKGRKAWQDSKHADGCKPTRRGLRAKRIGDAANPGPDQCCVWSENIRSWNSNNHDLLTDASKHDVDVLLLQETNISELASATLMNKAQRFGWQAVHVPPPSGQKNRGGVAILVKAVLLWSTLTGFPPIRDSGCWRNAMGCKKHFSLFPVIATVLMMRMKPSPVS